MNLTDPIADMLTRIRNANSVNKATHLDAEQQEARPVIACVLHEEGYTFKGYDVEDTVPQKTLHITLKYGPKKAQAYIWVPAAFPSRACVSTLALPTCPRVRGGLGTANYFHQPWRHDRPRCSQSTTSAASIIAYVW